MQSPSDIVIGLDSISRSFGSLKAVDALSFEVYRGEIVGLLGPNGAG
jgi:ABC-type branched-subunit amino acid transport system ATPase component